MGFVLSTHRQNSQTYTVLLSEQFLALEPSHNTRLNFPGSDIWLNRNRLGPLNVDTRQNPRRHVVFIEIKPMRKISNCLRWQGSP
jgi:hypothetical protein